jgi:hypothetical protein
LYITDSVKNNIRDCSRFSFLGSEQSGAHEKGERPGGGRGARLEGNRPGDRFSERLHNGHSLRRRAQIIICMLQNFDTAPMVHSIWEVPQVQLLGLLTRARTQFAKCVVNKVCTLFACKLC